MVFVIFLKVNGHYYGHPYHWILLNVKDADEALLNTLDTLTDSNVIVAKYIDERKEYDLEQSK